MGIFSFAQCVVITQLVSFKGIALFVAIHSVHPWEEENSRASCVTILVWSLKNIYKLFFSVAICKFFRLRDTYYFHLTDGDIESQRGLRNPFKVMQPECNRSITVWKTLWIGLISLLKT